MSKMAQYTEIRPYVAYIENEPLPDRYVLRLKVGTQRFDVSAGRKAIGIELKASYFAQAVKNLESVATPAMDQGAFALDGGGAQ